MYANVFGGNSGNFLFFSFKIETTEENEFYFSILCLKNEKIQHIWCMEYVFFFFYYYLIYYFILK